MKRVKDWPKRLIEVLERCEAQPFDWAERNCLSVVCDCVAAMTGTDLLAEHRGAYSDEESAMAIVAQHGGMERFVSHLFGADASTNTRMAGNGDVVLVDLPNGPTVGIFAGGTVWCMEEIGMLKIPRSLVVASKQSRVWKLGV